MRVFHCIECRGEFTVDLRFFDSVSPSVPIKYTCTYKECKCYMSVTRLDKDLKVYAIAKVVEEAASIPSYDASYC